MLLDAVKGTPAAALSMNEHFRTRTQVSTPFPVPESASSDSESAAPSHPRAGTFDTTDSEILNDNFLFGEYYSAGEMALISESFKWSNRDTTTQRVQQVHHG